MATEKGIPSLITYSKPELIFWEKKKLTPIFSFVKSNSKNFNSLSFSFRKGKINTFSFETISSKNQDENFNYGFD